MHKPNKITNFSFWEKQLIFENVDLVIVGSGIVGLSTAISYKQLFKKAKVLVLEKGILPQGASTKNAGFACFGSPSELISDLKITKEEEVWSTVKMRIDGLHLLRKRLGDKNIDYLEYGGYEVFDSEIKYNECRDRLNEFNKILKPITKTKETYLNVNESIKQFGFKNVCGLILNTNEGQIDTGMMMFNLLKLASELGVIILNTVDVKSINDIKNKVILETSLGELSSKKCIVCTNGLTKTLLPITDLKPARAQVLITKPIKNLKIKGTFHYNEGYNYFRNINGRLLLGGGRNLDFEKETTTEFALNAKIQKHLDKLLKQVILPNTAFEIDQRWSGIMGVGSEKKPIIKHVSPNVICAVRMGGMGVAIGSLVGDLAVKECCK